LTDVPDKSHMNGYGAGWFIDQYSNQVLHPGTLPNYSSMIILDTKYQNAVILLANLNAPGLPDLAQTLLYQIEHYQNFTALHQTAADNLVLLTITLWWVILMFTVLCAACIRNSYLLKQHRHLNKSSWLNKLSISLTVLIIIGLLYSTWVMPSWLLKDASWSIAFSVFPPVVLLIGLGSLLTLILSVLYFNSCILLKSNRPKL
ncbi:MAG: hypothetical protein L0K85_04520, partial [Staphylococcus simulans]|nr:hypothetical protein [Staphylococcus simulans]